MKLAVVTGGGTGIGAGAVRALAGAGLHVLAVGRRAGPLADVAASAPARITAVAADITTPDGRAAVEAAVRATGLPLAYVVQNAGVIGPIAPLATVSEASWRATMATNLDAPLFLLQALLPHLAPGARVLHVSSGAAHSVIEGWGAYCVSKCAFHMLYQVLRAELAPRGIVVGSVRPGVVETAMQEEIRAGAFPDKARFEALHAARRVLPDGAAAAAPPDGGLDDPRNVGEFMRWLLLSTSDEDFSAREWDIRAKEHHARWVGGGAAIGGAQ